MTSSHDKPNAHPLSKSILFPSRRMARNVVRLYRCSGGLEQFIAVLLLRRALNQMYKIGLHIYILFRASTANSLE